jgi:hypothetical protein
MERQLKANDHKDGWRNCTDDYLEAKLGEEVRELKEAVQAVQDDIAYAAVHFGGGGDRGGLLGLLEAVVHEAADVANIAMMIADKSKPNQPLYDRLAQAKAGEQHG